MAFKMWVEKELIPLHLETGIIDRHPSLYNRAYYPNAEDIRIMVKKLSLKNEIHNLIEELYFTYCRKKKKNIN